MIFILRNFYLIKIII